MKRPRLGALAETVFVGYSRGHDKGAVSLQSPVTGTDAWPGGRGSLPLQTSIAKILGLSEGLDLAPLLQDSLQVGSKVQAAVTQALKQPRVLPEADCAV